MCIRDRLYAELANILLPHSRGAILERAMALIAHLQALPARLGLPTRLRDVGVTERDLESLARDASQQTRLLGNNPREMSLDDIHAVYQQVF